MNLAMGVPLKVATATSNMMIGITAAASAIIYLHPRRHRPVRRGPDGDRCLHRRDGRHRGSPIGSTSGYLRLLFVVVLLFTAFQMFQRVLA